MGRYQPFAITRFGGLNQNENPHALAPGDLVEARNIVHKGDSIGTRPGLRLEASGKQYENATTGGNPIQGLFEHREGVDAGRHLLAVGYDGVGQAVFYNDAALLPDLATITGGQNNIWTFASHNNNTYAAGGLQGTDDFWYTDGVVGTGATAIAAVDSGTNALLPKYVFAWRNYLFLGGLNPATSLPDNNASTVRFCDFGTDPTVAANWKVGNTIGYTAYGKSHNTGLAGFRDNTGDWLLLLYNDHIHVVKLDPTSGFNVPFFVNDKISNGCVGQRAYVDLGLDSGDAIYMSEQGIHTIRQSQQFGSKTEAFISWKIRPFFNTLNRSRLKYTVGEYDRRNGRVLYAVSTGSNTAHDAILCLDVAGDEEITAKNARWSIWYLAGGKKVNELLYARDEDDVWRMYAGTTDGEVGYFDDDAWLDLDGVASPSSYKSEFQTAHNAHGSMSTTKGLGDVLVTVGPAGTFEPSLRARFDYDRKISKAYPITMPSSRGGLWGTMIWGSDVWGTADPIRDAKIYAQGSGRTLGFSIDHQGDRWFVSSIAYQLRGLGEDTGDTG